MSKQSKRHTPLPKPQPAKTGRPVWLGPTLLALVGIAVAGGLVWLVQRNNTAPAQTLPGAAGSTSVTTANGPSIAVDQELFDYGNVKLNSTIETVIQVKNTGDQALALDQNPVVELVDGC